MDFGKIACVLGLNNFFNLRQNQFNLIFSKDTLGKLRMYWSAKHCLNLS